MKAILLIDINDELLEDYDYIYVDYDLRGEIKNDNVIEIIRHVEDCPLKPLPHNDFIDEVESYMTEEEYNAYVSGWNECLDEILGGEE